MKIFYGVILGILVFLALSSGMTKIMLMQQDVDFFGKYGFSNPILIIYGLTQVIGGILLIFSKTRAIGALIVATTFLISLVVLLMSGNFPFAIITSVCLALLGFVIKQSLSTKNINNATNNT